jgi:hypothetical protein
VGILPALVWITFFPKKIGDNMENLDFIYTMPEPPTSSERRERAEGSLEDRLKDWEAVYAHCAMGTSRYWQHTLSKWRYTDGVRFMAMYLHAWWLVDLLCSYPQNHGRVLEDTGGIQFARIDVNLDKKQGVVQFYDDSSEENHHHCVTWLEPYGNKTENCPNFLQALPYTNFPLEELTFCRQSGVIYLMREH